MSFPYWFSSGHNEAEFLRCVLDHISDYLVAVDTEGRIVLINAPYCRLLGGPPEDFIGRHITEVVSNETRLHLVANGSAGVTLAPLKLRGRQVLARQVPVYQEDQIVGAVGLALFSDLGSLQRIAEQIAQSSSGIRSPQTPWTANYRLADIIGKGPAMESVRTEIRRAASLDLPALIQGETGTGKELAANAIHALSERAKRPFVWVNCASIPENLVDSELFGYEGGSFTGARSRGKPGKFELASGGTLFLDEIGDMPLNLQPSLLRALQNKEIVRVGGTSPIKVDVRILCATNLPLDEMVAAGKFRADLYFRLNVLSVKMPAVRHREDFDFLVEALMDRLCRQHGMPVRPLTTVARNRFRKYNWPGNVRQLEAALLRYSLTGDIRLEMPAEVSKQYQAGEDLNLERHLKRERRKQIARAIDVAGGDREHAARLLGVSRATIYRELQRQ